MLFRSLQRDARVEHHAQQADDFQFGVEIGVIPRNVRLAEAPSYGQPGVTFDPSSKGAVAFVEFAKEMAQRLG